MGADEFWVPWEQEIASFEDARSAISTVSAKCDGSVLAWRGQVDASWPLHSSLYRRLCWTSPEEENKESALYDLEGKILTEVHRWGLHRGQLGRLSVLNQLALLQHYGAPTRLVDITFNPYIGLWFAVEEQWRNTVVTHEDIDGRLFAVNCTDRLINEDECYRPWEDELKRPWRPEAGIDEWSSYTYVWKPANFEARIAAQHGGFLLGGVPSSSAPNGPQQWPRSTKPGDGKFTIAEVRGATSLPFRVHKLDSLVGRPPTHAAYTFRIKAAAKKEIRENLERIFSYKHSTIYPDFTGFAAFAARWLRTSPT